MSPNEHNLLRKVLSENTKHTCNRRWKKRKENLSTSSLDKFQLAETADPSVLLKCSLHEPGSYKHSLTWTRSLLSSQNMCGRPMRRVTLSRPQMWLRRSAFFLKCKVKACGLRGQLQPDRTEDILLFMEGRLPPVRTTSYIYFWMLEARCFVSTQHFELKNLQAFVFYLLNYLFFWCHTLSHCSYLLTQ